MAIPRYFDDWDEFTRWCYWWVEIKNWMDAELPPGYRFADAYDVQRDFRVYFVTFKHWDQTKPLGVRFDRSTGTMRVFYGRSGPPKKEDAPSPRH